MIKQIFKRNPQLFMTFESQNWNKLKNVKQIENILQKLIVEICKEYGIENKFPKIKIRLLNNAEKGKFDLKENTICLSYDLFISKLKPPYYINKTPLFNSLNNKECFEVLMHELRHALQQRPLEINNQMNEEFDWQLLYYNQEHKQNKYINAYFSVNDNDLSVLLYHIQPIERDAFVSTQQICKQFNKLMKSLYPDDKTFEYVDDFSQFQESVVLAKLKFHTETPFEDIDDIIRYINGIKPLKPLNQEMWDAVKQTQSKQHNILNKIFYEETSFIEELQEFNEDIDLSDEIERN